MSAVSEILGAAGGVSGVGQGVGDVICAIKGTCQPENVSITNNPAPASNNSMLLLIVGGAVVVVMMVMLFKN